MTIRVCILKNKGTRQATLDLVPKLSGGTVVLAKQAYVFGGPIVLREGDGDALLAMPVANGATRPPAPGHFHSQVSVKDPWPVKADQKIALPAELLPKPFHEGAFRQAVSTAPRNAANNYNVFCVRELTPDDREPTLDLTGVAAFLWYGRVSLHGSAPVVLVSDAALDLADIVALASVDVVDVDVSSRATSLPLPEPAFDLRVVPFSVGI